jgi:ribosomal protein S27AE
VKGKTMDDLAKGFYVVFDGPPSHESGRFVEVEGERGFSQGPSHCGADWQQRGELWYLGPFADARAGEAELPRFDDLGVDLMRFQGGTVVLRTYGCSRCGKIFWVEDDEKLKAGAHNCPHCGALNEATP